MANSNAGLHDPTYPSVLSDESYKIKSNASRPYQLAYTSQSDTQEHIIDLTEGISARLSYLSTSMLVAQDDESTSMNNNTSSVGVGNNGDSKARLRKACDSCSIRKVKCDEEGPPCRACASLEIPCTFERPSRRRGPPNRHAEAIKKRRFKSETQTSSPHTLPNSPTNATHPLIPVPPQAALNAESICPMSLLLPLIDDYFTYIHPLTLIPHEPTFRESLQRRDDLSDSTFLSLLAAMIGCLVISFPRKPRRHLKAQRKENEFPKSIDLVDRCHSIAIKSRGPGIFDKDLKVYDAGVSYLLGLIAAYGYRWRQCKLYFGECLLILRSLGLHKAQVQQSPVGSPPLQMPGDNKVDFVAQEMGRRTFWVLFVGVKSLHQLGASCTELLIPPETPSNPYPPLPAEVDDEYIYKDKIQAQPANIIAKTIGFNANVRIFCSYNTLSTIDMAYGIDNCVDWERQESIVKRCLLKCKNCLIGLPRQLQLNPGHLLSDFSFSIGESREDINREQYYRDEHYLNLHAPEGSTEYRRNIQCEIQKANIYITQLGTRSHIVEKYWAICEQRQRRLSPTSNSNQASLRGNMMFATCGNIDNGASGNLTFERQGPDSPQIGDGAPEMTLRTLEAEFTQVDEHEMAQEREDIVRDLLIVLGTISQVNMEPNGGSLIHKIRQIASTLLDVPKDRKGALALSAEQCLSTFLEVLIKLEKTSEPRASHSEAERGVLGSTHEGGLVECDDEEAELRHWADLREYQNQFAQAGGVLSEL